MIGLSIRSPRLLARAYVPLLNRFSSRFVACSTAVATMLTDNGVDRDAIDLVHNSISLDEVESSAQHPSPLPLSGPRVGMVAAYDPRKGHDLFVAAAALIAQSHPDARFYLIGGVLDDRPESAAFEQAVRRSIEAKGLTGRLEQVGVVASSERYPWIRALDVVVAPSRTEGFAYALLEAMACARPIVATAIEGNLDAIVDGESGLLVEVTPGAIAAGISSLLADPIRGAALGQAAYRGWRHGSTTESRSRCSRRQSRPSPASTWRDDDGRGYRDLHELRRLVSVARDHVGCAADLLDPARLQE